MRHYYEGGKREFEVHFRHSLFENPITLTISETDPKKAKIKCGNTRGGMVLFLSPPLFSNPELSYNDQLRIPSNLEMPLIGQLFER